MMKTYKAVTAAILAAALVACGGGGGSAGTNPNAVTTTTTTTTTTTDTTTTPAAQSVASIDVFTSAQSLPSANNSTVTLTVLPKDANNNALPSQAVSFSTNSGTLTGSLPTPSTGSKGEPVTGVGIGAGTDRTNRNITVTVTSGSVSKQVTIPVVGSTLSLTGVSFVKQGLSSQFTVRALDSAGNAVPGVTPVVTSSKGNTISALTATDNAGNSTFTFTATTAGTDTLKVTGLGTQATAQVLVSADEFSFDSPASNTVVNVGVAQPVTVKLLAGGVGVVGTNVTFSTTRGTFAGGASTATVATGAGGFATATVTSTSAGPATITAQTAATQVTLPLTFTAVTPASLALQANPGAIPPNAAGSFTNQVALSALVRDANGNPVANKLVTFSASPDPSGGTINPPTATTDAGGTATSTFFPGPTTTANNGVTLSATVQGTAVTGTTNLTVNAQAAFISIATGNEIGNLNPTTYAKDFAVTVVDVNGAPVAGKVVTLSVIPTTYTKGVLKVTGTTWAIDTATAVVCANEDANRNGVLDLTPLPSEDTNGDGLLQPGNPATLSVPSITTGANGVGTFTLYYGENFAPWVNVNLTARTTVGGTESVKIQSYNLVGSAPDFTSPSVPAATTSPFGVNACNVPN